MRKTLFALALASITFAGAAFAGQIPPPPPPSGPGMHMGGMMRMDANGDGVITRDEAIAQADAQFDRMDANHDGTVTPEERSAAFEAMRAARGGESGEGRGMGNRMGGAGDASMTRDQFRARALARFDRMDANHDGKIDQAEMDAMRQMRMEHRGEGAPPPAGQQ